MMGCIQWPSNTNKHRRGRPYVYSPTVIVRCFVVRIWFRLDSNNALHIFLNTGCHYNRKLALACGLLSIPRRRTFDRRLKTISTDVKEMISAMGHLFVTEGFGRSHCDCNRQHSPESKRSSVAQVIHEQRSGATFWH